MSKQWMVYGGVGLAIGVVSVAIGMLVTRARQSSSSIASPVATQLPSATDEVPQTKTYADAAGFSFEYSSSLIASDETPDDESYYSVVVLKDKTGMKTTITVVDEETGNIPKTAGQPMSVTLGTLDAKQYQGNGKLITIATDEGVSYMLESIKDSGFWEGVHQQILTSFTFSNPQAAQKTESPGSVSSNDLTEEIIYEDEEVIE